MNCIEGTGHDLRKSH